MSKRFSRFWVRCFLGILFLTSFIFCLCLGYSSSPARVAGTSANAEQIVERGVQLYQQGKLTQSIAQWQTALKIYQNSDNKTDAAVVLENLARAYQQIGQNNSAINHWQEAINNYRQLGDIQQLGRSLTEQAQVYSRIGQHRQAIALLCNSDRDCLSGTALQIARQQKDLQGEAAALGSLGEAYRLRGNYQQAIAYLESSLKIAKQVNNSQLSVSALNSLGNARSSLAAVNYRRAESALGRGDKQESQRLSQKAREEDRQAIADFENLQLASAQGDKMSQMKGLLNSIPVYYRIEDLSTAASNLQQALSLLDTLPERRDKVYAAIDLAKLLQPETNFEQCIQPQVQPQAITLLQKAAAIAQNLQDERAQSFALGAWGHIYECRQEYEQALKLTQQARLAAEQDLQNQDSLYQWEWQTGRIFKAQKQPEQAIAAYEKAIATLETIRGNILTANRDIQFDFRDKIEPIYRNLVALKLAQISSFTTIKKEQNSVVNLNSALDNIDSLRLAELQNYFGNDCAIREFSQTTTTFTSPDTYSAIFSSIVLPNRTGIIVSFPNQTKKIAWLDRNQDSLRQEIIEFRRGLGRYFDGNYNTQQAQKIYSWLIAPFADELKQQQIKTLVFIQDGILRSIPMSALHDGKQFLIEQYAIATTPSLKLTDLTKNNRQQLKALALGFNEEAKIDNRIFRPLPKVAEEINGIEQELKGSKGLLNQEFTRDRLQQELNQTVYEIVHIATHGEFGAEPEDTFLVTGDRRKLTIAQLDEIMRSTPQGTSQIELLSLTACKTAIGDERAALGLAGVAVQAGVRSVLASLWSIEDTVTPQMVEEFYTALQNPSLNKAQALQQAQIKLIKGGKYAHPAYWSPFILIGNWL